VSDVATAAIGFVGLGDMGGRIASRLLRSGYSLSVADRRPEAVAELVAEGAAAPPDLATLAAASDIVGICVVDDAQVLDVVAQLPLRSGSLLVIHSSVLPATVHELAQRLDASGVRVVDAPVSGSRPAADAGTLTALVGGSAADVERVRPLLEAYCSNVIHAGELGAGQLLKIANNVLLHMNHLIAVEAVRFARENGITETALIEAANVSSGRSWVTETWGLIDRMLLDHPLAGTDGVYSIMSKEMWHAVELSREHMRSMPLTALGTQLAKTYLQERESVAPSV
jgi:3-hydroxyisobutyrate dehydrogenase